MNQLKLYSLSEAASVMGIGRDTLRSLLSEGRIGYILVGRSKRIAHQELIRFQSESTVRETEPVKSKLVSDQDLKKMFDSKNLKKVKPTFDSKQLLKKIMRNDNNGHSKKKRQNMAHSMV